MKKIDWKDYITLKPSINQTLIKPFAQELAILYQSLSEELTALKEQQKTEIQRLQSHKITNLDAVLQRHSDQLSKVQDRYFLQMNLVKKEQKDKIYTFAPSDPVKVLNRKENSMFSVSFGTVMPKIYHVDFQVFSEIKHDLDSCLNARVNYVSDVSKLTTKPFYTESQKSTEFYYLETPDQLKELCTKDLHQGDFFITRHSNLDSKILFHLLISDDSLDCKYFNLILIDHKSLLGLRSIIKLCVTLSISELVIPIIFPVQDVFKTVKSAFVECPWRDSSFKLVFSIKNDMLPSAMGIFHKVFK